MLISHFVKPISILASVILLSSCSTEVDVNTEYREIPVMYAMLDIKADTQYILLNKVFTNQNTDANIIAANYPDSITYGDEGEIFLIGAGSDSTKLEKVLVTNKQPGVFSYPNQYVYIRTTPINNTNYKLFFRNTLTGVTASSNTPVVHSSTNPSQSFAIVIPAINPVELALPDRTLFLTPRSIEHRKAVNGFQYSVDINMVVVNLPSTGPDTVNIPWRLSSDSRSEFTPGSTMSVRYFAQDFINVLLANLNKNTGYQRYFAYYDVIVVSASSEFSKYNDVANNFSPISQTKPTYTNVTNGLGIVASKTFTERRYLFGERTHQYLIDIHPDYGFRQPPP